MNHIYNNKGKKETITSLIIDPNKHVWLRALKNKLGRLDQGKDHVFQYTYTIYLIFISEVPNYRSVIYASFVYDYKTLKSEPYFLCCVSGGDKLDYPDYPGSTSASIIETKFLLGSTIYDEKKGTQFMSCNLKDLFLASLTERT